MNKYSKMSEHRLKTCDKRLQKVFKAVLQIMDHAVIQGHRGKQEQNAAFKNGASKVKYPKGKHNSFPSKAVDIAPWPLEWPETAKTKREKMKRIMRFCYFAGVVLGVSSRMGIKVRWGGDWDQDRDLSDNNFDDLVHFEVI